MPAALETRLRLKPCSRNRISSAWEISDFCLSTASAPKEGDVMCAQVWLAMVWPAAAMRLRSARPPGWATTLPTMKKVVLTFFF